MLTALVAWQHRGSVNPDGHTRGADSSVVRSPSTDQEPTREQSTRTGDALSRYRARHRESQGANHGAGGRDRPSGRGRQGCRPEPDAAGDTARGAGRDVPDKAPASAGVPARDVWKW